MAKRGPGRPFVKGKSPAGAHAPWKPGESGNPLGRPKVAAEVVLFARERSIPALRVLEEVMLDKKQGGSVRIAAAQALLDRGWGRPHQAVSVGDDIGAMTDAELIAELRAAMPKDPPPKDATAKT